MISHADATLRYYTKCLLMPLLIIFTLVAVYDAGKKYAKFLLVTALMFSWAGDVLLVQDDQLSFMTGLASFLLAHIAYLLFFGRISRRINPYNKLLLVTIIIMLVYSGMLLWLLWNSIGDLKVPVTLYAVVISSMLIAAVQTVKVRRLSSRTTLLFITGAMLFVLSDSILALDKFYYSWLFLQVLVMITYAAAQWLLVRGAIRYIRKI